jgi:DNA-binding NtrC family response regulator
MKTKKYRILIVDDDESIIEVFAAALSQAGYEVSSAKNGKEAVEMSDKNNYHLALIDLRLPDTEGIQLLEAFRRSNPNMKRLIVTGFPTVSNTIEALNKRADGYLLKPVNLEGLLREVEKHLREREEEVTYSEQKVAEFVNARIKEIKDVSARV